MPIQTDLSISPYFDDYNQEKNFHKILFRPGVSVQARELNQLQTILQNQIERFGDNIFKQGTIIDGCDISVKEYYPYVKINDNDSTGAPVNVLAYESYYVKNEANLEPVVAAIGQTVSGYESQSPDLNTLYVRYLNTGYANVGGNRTSVTTFAANDTLTVYNPNYVIERITPVTVSAGFSNTDPVVILSAIAVQNTSGGTEFDNPFTVGDQITDGAYANATITYVQTVYDSELQANVVAIGIKPLTNDLRTANTELWTFATDATVSTPASDVGTIVSIVGTGAQASLKTGVFGEVDTISMLNKGRGYYTLPSVTIASQGAAFGQIENVDIVSQNYLAKVSVAQEVYSPVGTGYAVHVGTGIVYQKGYFTRVPEHEVVVEKYASVADNKPNGKSLVFVTNEDIITSNIDETLLDNATGSPNYAAPGANRLELTPTLQVIETLSADAASHLAIASFSQGNMFLLRQTTEYNVIGNEIAKRVSDSTGDYVLDQFYLNTKSPITFTDEATKFSIVVDPGAAYINGKKVVTNTNYEQQVDKAIDAGPQLQFSTSLNYGTYIRVKEVGGQFYFKTGSLVNFYSTAKQYVTSYFGADIDNTFITSLGTSIGSARIRSIVHESGAVGTPGAIYRIYLFDVVMSEGKTFAAVRSLVNSGDVNNRGIADAVLEGGVAVLKDTASTALVYKVGTAIKSGANDFSYIYRTVINDAELTTGGLITISVPNAGEVFPYTGALSPQQEDELVIVPLANVSSSSNITGSLSCNSTSYQVNGSGTLFDEELEVGDFIKLNGSGIVLHVNSVTNATSFVARGLPLSDAVANTAVLFFPQNVPISLTRDSRAVNTNISRDQLTINIGTSLSTSSQVSIAYNVQSANTIAVTKSPQRNAYVRIRLANNSAGVAGPWPVGVPDVFRLRGVYFGNSSSFAPDDTGVTDVTSSFYVDHNQTKDYYGTSYLYKEPNAAFNPYVANSTSGDDNHLLVKFDYFTHSSNGGLKFANSTYSINDSLTLDQLTTSINTLEIPELYTSSGKYYDLRDCADFRPVSVATVSPNTSPAFAPVNPSEPTNTARFGDDDKKFPAPVSALTGSITSYLERQDRVTIDENNTFHVVRGTPAAVGRSVAPPTTNNSLTINLLKVPPYPSLPYKLSESTIAIADTKIASEKNRTNTRLKTYRITTPYDEKSILTTQPRGYTMQDIGKLERRIQDLEYYTSLSLVESGAQKRIIPSSANNSLDRFKFGFFVDSFDNFIYSDTTNPGYSAAIVEGCLAPKINEINFQLVSGGKTDTITSQATFNDYVLVQQTAATKGPPPAPPPPPPPTAAPPPPPPPPPPPVQITRQVRQMNTNFSSSDYGDVFEEFTYQFSSLPGTATMYFNARDTWMSVIVYQKASSVDTADAWVKVTSSASARIMNSTEVNQYNLYSLGGYWGLEHTDSLVNRQAKPFYIRTPLPEQWIEDNWTLVWNHDPTKGRDIKVRVYKGKDHGEQGVNGKFEYMLRYPADQTAEDIAAANSSIYDLNTTNFLGINLGNIGLGLGTN